MTIEATRVTEPTPFPDPPEWLVFEPWETRDMKWWSVDQYPHKDAADKAIQSTLTVSLNTP